MWYKNRIAAFVTYDMLAELASQVEEDSPEEANPLFTSINEQLQETRRNEANGIDDDNDLDNRPPSDLNITDPIRGRATEFKSGDLGLLTKPDTSTVNWAK